MRPKYNGLALAFTPMTTHYQPILEGGGGVGAHTSTTGMIAPKDNLLSGCGGGLGGGVAQEYNRTGQREQTQPYPATPERQRRRGVRFGGLIYSFPMRGDLKITYRLPIDSLRLPKVPKVLSLGVVLGGSSIGISIGTPNDSPSTHKVTLRLLRSHTGRLSIVTNKPKPPKGTYTTHLLAHPPYTTG